MTEIVIRVADRTLTPGPRYARLGRWSGEWFRGILLMACVVHPRARFVIDLDGTIGYGSSFLSEAFAGLVIREGWSPDELRRRFRFVSEEDPSYVTEILDYVARAATGAAR